MGYNMFAYCVNNPSNYIESRGARPVGIGLQIDLTAGGVTAGAEVVIYFDEQVCDGSGLVIAGYTYSGAEFSAEDMFSIQSLIDSTVTIFSSQGDTNMDAMLFLMKAAMEGANLSGAVFYIDGNDDFCSMEDYSGSFTTICGTVKFNIYQAGAYFSFSDTCKVIGIRVGICTPNAQIIPLNGSISVTEYSKPVEFARI